MNMFLMDNELLVRLGFFLGIFSFMAAWEALFPRRILSVSKGVRWLHNLSITFVNSAVVRLLFPITAIGTAVVGEERGWGMFTALEMDSLTAGVLSIIALDLVIYLQHVLFHRVPLLWRLHRMHHTDLDIDVTTGARFHPVEIVLSMGIKMGAVALMGAPAWSVLTFEIVLNGTSMFNHSNVFLHPRIDRVVRLFVVTPDMHRVHHSVIMRETNSNFGFNLPWWDRLSGTYTAQPSAGHEGMTIGLANYRDPKYLTLRWMLAVPFIGKER